MDIDVYHFIGWAVAVCLPGVGWMLTRHRGAIAGLAAAFVLLSISAQHAGLAPLESRWHNPRYMFGAVMLALGVLAWLLTINRFPRGESRN